MSIQAREALVKSPNTIFQRDSQRVDLLSLALTQSPLIALLTYICITKNHPVEFTAIKTDHHNDSGLGLHCHFNGYCADLWPLASATAEDYLEATDPRFQAFLRDCAASAWLYQIGLAGSAYTTDNLAAAGPKVFHDDGADHIHLGAV